MVSLSHLHHSFSRLVLHLLWSRKQSDSKLCSGACAAVGPAALVLGTHPALLPAALLMRSDSGDVERLRVQHEAWQKRQLQPQTCPDQFCFQCKLCVRHGVGKKQVHGQMATRAAEFYCGSQSLLCFFLCLYRALCSLQGRSIHTVWKTNFIFSASKSKDFAACCKSAREQKWCKGALAPMKT